MTNMPYLICLRLDRALGARRRRASENVVKSRRALAWQRRGAADGSVDVVEEVFEPGRRRVRREQVGRLLPDRQFSTRSCASRCAETTAGGACAAATASDLSPRQSF